MTVTRHYVTACRAWQLPVLARSMLNHCAPFVLHVLAWDWEPGPPWTAWGEDRCDVVYMSRETFLARHPELRKLPGEPRGPTDTVCSVRWTFALDVMRQTGQPVTLIDGDLFFFASPEPVFEEIGDARWAVSPHRFPRARDGLPGATEETHLRFGRYNAGWTYFADPTPARAMAALAVEWCRSGFLRWPDGRLLYGDQGYLEVVSESIPAHVIRHPGVNLAPWNLRRYNVAAQPGGGIWVAEPAGPQGPLVSFHFSSLRWEDGRLSQLANTEYAVDDYYRDLIYEPYLSELRRILG